MGLKQNSGEGGTVGTTATIANSGGASGDAFGQISITGSPSFTYASNAVMHGSRSYRVAGAAADVLKAYLINTGSSSGATRVYIRFNTLPSAAHTLVQFQNSNFSNGASIGLNSSNQLIVQNVVGTVLYTAPSTVDVGVWYRLELQSIVGNATNSGTIAFQYYIGDAITASGSYRSSIVNTGTDVSIIRSIIGKHNTTSALDTNFDDFAYDDSTSNPIGSLANQAPVANAGTNQTNIEPYTTVVLSGADSDSDGVIVQRVWSQTAGSPTVQLSGSGTTRTFMAPGTLSGTTLTFAYQVYDNDGVMSAQDTVTVTIMSATERAAIDGEEVPVSTKAIIGGALQ